MKKSFVKIACFASSVGAPLFALAAEFQTDYLDSLISGGVKLTKNILIFLISLAVVWLIWNVIKYSMSAEDDDKAKAKSQMISGIIALTVIVSIWAIVQILNQMFFSGVDSSAPNRLMDFIPNVDSNSN